MNCHASAKPSGRQTPNPESGTSLQKLVHLYQKEHAPKLRAQLDYFRHQNFKEALEHAAEAVDANNKRYFHQFRIRRTAINEAKAKLLAAKSQVRSCRSYDVLHSLLSGLFTPISGLGPLYIYDTALRLGANLNLEPQVVYIHAGTKTGVLALGLSTTEKSISVIAFPKPIHVLTPHEIEDFLCIFSNHLRELPVTKSH